MRLTNIPELLIFTQVFANLQGERHQGNLLEKQGFISHRSVNLTLKNTTEVPYS